MLNGGIIVKNEVSVLTTPEEVKKEFFKVDNKELEDIIKKYESRFTADGLIKLIKSGCDSIEQLLIIIDNELYNNGFDLKLIYLNHESSEYVYNYLGFAKLFALFGYENKYININIDEEVSLMIFNNPKSKFSFSVTTLGTLICPSFGSNIYTDIVLLESINICIE